MKLQLRVLGGARAGVTGVFSRAEVTLGRHPACEFVFDSEDDLAVSGRHAMMVRRGPHWAVRDLESRNGTLVNGHRIRGDTRLDDTDQVRLGPDGPTIEVRLVPDATPDRAPARPTDGIPPRATGPARAPAVPASPAPRQRGPSTTQRVKVEVGRQTRRHRVFIGLLVSILAVGGGYAVWDRQARDAERARERAGLETRIDSILRASEAALARLQGEAEGLAEALRRSRQEMERLQAEVRAADAAGRSEEADRLREQLAFLTQALSIQQAAATVDFRAIHEANHRAVAVIWAEFAQGDVESGTAFAIRDDGILITNRHVLLGKDGTRRPRRLAVQFTNSSQVWPATLLGASPDSATDLAAVRVEGIRGRVPAITVPDPAPPVRPGDPVATIGFPFGDLPIRAGTDDNVIRATLTAGIVSQVLPDDIQIDGYGAQGASGSPVFDRDGRLIGVLYGGEAGTNGRIVYLVPVNSVTTLLRDLAVSSPG